MKIKTKYLVVIIKVIREEFVFCGWYALQLAAQNYLHVLADRGKIPSWVFNCHNSPDWFLWMKFREIIKILFAL